jgi:hypothetical protein
VRTLVVGRYPPPSSSDARGTMTLVRELARAGAEVSVLAQPFSAATRRARIDGPSGAFRVWRLRNRYDEVYVVAEAVLRHPTGHIARLTRIVDCAIWAAVLRRSSRVHIVLLDADNVPGSVGGRTGRLLWRAASRVIVADDHTKQRLVEQGGADASRIDVRDQRATTVPRQDDDWSAAKDAQTASALIRKRAARDRRAAQ